MTSSTQNRKAKPVRTPSRTRSAIAGSSKNAAQQGANTRCATAQSPTPDLTEVDTPAVSPCVPDAEIDPCILRIATILAAGAARAAAATTSSHA